MGQPDLALNGAPHTCRIPNLAWLLVARSKARGLTSLVVSGSLLLAVPSVRGALLTAVLLAPVAGIVVHALALRSAHAVVGPATVETVAGPA